MAKQDFNADVTQLIQLVTHSIYSNKEIFLRELISNASDALAKANIQSLQDANYLGDDHNLAITIAIDEKEKVITLSDNGIGMNKEDVIEHIGTIAKSGTKAFLEKIQKEKNESDNQLIGQFGIGFYSVFMVADKVELETKTAEGEAVLRSSDGKGSYEIKTSKKENRGTSIRIYLNKEAEEYANSFRVKSLIKKHSNYVPYPVLLQASEEEIKKAEENQETSKTDFIEKNGKSYTQTNKSQSLRSKQSSEVSDEEYKEFYQSISFDQEAPLDHLHLHVEGKINFKALLYIPQKKNPFASMMPEQDYGPSLYVQNVLIKDNCKDLLPQWLRFVKGIVETPDLPLNVSREILQNNALMSKIQSSLVKKILDALSYQMRENPENYQEFHNSYGKILKEGIHFDRNNKEKIASCITFASLKTEKNISLDSYIDALPKEEKKEKTDKKKEEEKKPEETTKWNIYYLTGKSLTDLQNSPYLEQFKSKDIDVLLMTDPIDDRVVQALTAYKDYKLVNAQHADLWSDDKEEKKKKKETDKLNKENKDFLAFAKGVIGDDKIDNIELTHKLTDTLAVLVTKEGQASAQMEQYMKAMGQNVPQSKKDFQINANHPILLKAIEAHKKDEKDETLKNTLLYAYDQAQLLQGTSLENISEFIKRVNNLIK